MIINNNMMAMNTHRQLSLNNTAGAKSIEKLSSGFRINRAGDDAAGLAISEKMRAQIRGLNQASRNAQDGISMIQTAEGALNETHDILQRMRELATQSANDTNVNVDRNEIQKEINQLSSEINRIGNTTEFNTQALLKGKTQPVTENAATQNTIVAGEAGVAAGAVSPLNTTANSVKAIASTTSVQASTAEATGAVKDFTITTNSIAGAKGTVSLNNGISFTTVNAADTLNGAKVEIVQSTGTGTGAEATRTGSGASAVYTIELGTDAEGNSLFTGTNRGELFNYVQTLVNASVDVKADISLNAMDGATTGEELTTIVSSGTLAGGVTETLGEYEFTLSNAFEEAGDTISFGGKTFKAVFGTADVTKGEFSIGSDAQTISNLDAQAAALKTTILDASQIGDRFADNSSDTNVIKLIENAGQATGVDVTAPTVAGAGTDDKLAITNLNGQNLKTVTIARAADDNLAVTQTNGNLTISLANTTASKNSAANIEAAVNALGTQDGVDFTQYRFEGQGNWDSSTIGNSITKDIGTLVGGTEEIKGSYNFDIKTAFAEGDIVEIAGQAFKAVASGAKVSEGEFNVSDGDINAQAASLRDAISLNTTLKAKYEIGGSATNITLTEKVGSGVDLKQTELDVRATGTQGQYSVAAPEIMESGAKFVIDGQEIVVSNKETHIGYDNGTAIKAADSVEDQAAALVEAINKNDNLAQKYTASVGADGSIMLTQKEAFASNVAPAVSTFSSAEGNFEATFQIGSNTGQSMTIEVADTRSAALGVTGDGSAATVKAKNGAVASYVQTKNVSNGTDNTAVEFALDVSDHTKATAAISVLNDAIEFVSAQRSQLGAFQNRLEHTIKNLGTSAENMQAAESRVRDLDMAQEMMNFTKNNILQQAAQAMLAQANQAPQGVLQLLR